MQTKAAKTRSQADRLIIGKRSCVGVSRVVGSGARPPLVYTVYVETVTSCAVTPAIITETRQSATLRPR